MDFGVGTVFEFSTALRRCMILTLLSQFLNPKLNKKAKSIIPGGTGRQERFW